MSNVRVALVHDSFTQRGGAERVVKELHRMFPQAPVYTLVLDRGLKSEYGGWDIRTSWLQVIYNFFPKFQYLFPFIPLALYSLKFEGYDLVISSSSSFAKNIHVPKGCVHINYCHTPTRFLWIDTGYIDEELPRWLLPLRPLIRQLVKWMKRWDYAGAQRVTHFIANSNETKARIKIYYHRDSEVVYPCVDTNFWHPTRPKQSYFLLAGRLQAHKRNDVIVEIFNELGLPLHVVGTGRQERHLRSIAKPNITFLGRISDEELRDEYSGAKAYLFPQLEDLGLMPIEAASCGTATLAYGKGGSLETVVSGVTGELFGSYDKEEIKQFVEAWDQTKYSVNALREQAERFGRERFEQKINGILTRFK